jgi:GT2 family glycosyltransferase
LINKVNNPVGIDIIILSYAKDKSLLALSCQTINTLVYSEDSQEISFNIIVIESNKSLKPFQYEHTTTIYTDEPFGYNRYMNIGIKASSNPYICICNNDLQFYKGWASQILRQMSIDKDLMSVNPYCEISHKKGIEDNGQNVVSTVNGILIGWCIFFKREILNITGYLDEKFKFWYADNDYGNTMAKFNIKHALVTSSKVTHLGSKTHSILSEGELFEYTYGQFLYYDLKWNNKSALSYHFKSTLLPAFKYFYLNRLRSKRFMLLCRLFSKLYGGLR